MPKDISGHRPERGNFSRKGDVAKKILYIAGQQDMTDGQ